jgi:prepilin-type N-terminal cleavage/methylation domain-containing protein
MQRVQRGFTLIEVLVVVSILGVLAGLISILVVQSGGKRLAMETQMVVQTQLPTAINRFKAEISNRLPPMTVAELAAFPGWAGLSITGNTTNECVECLYVALRHKDLTTPLSELAGANPFGNTDDDIWNKVPEGCDAPEAKEILDAYGNPIVYITKNAYNAPVRIVKPDGTEVEVHAQKRPSGVYYNPDTFQLISLGKNGVQDDDAEGDDIENFKREEE